MKKLKTKRSPPFWARDDGSGVSILRTTNIAENLVVKCGVRDYTFPKNQTLIHYFALHIYVYITFVGSTGE